MFLALVITIIILSASLSVCINIIVTSTRSPIANASADVTFGQAPLNISFNASGFDPDDGEIIFYHWDFGDGNTSDKQNPTHTYYWRGKFYASLTVTDDDGENGTDILEINIIDYQSPIAIASANVTCGKAPLEISFNGSGFDTNGKIGSYKWDFGDSTSSNKQNIKHTYKNPGKYYVILTVTDNDELIGIDRLEINAIENYQPIAYAKSDVTNGKAPLTVRFSGWGQDKDGYIDSYQWIFEDVIISSNRISNEKETTHIYWLPGIYLAKFTVFDEDGANDTVVIKIEVEESMVSSFYISLIEFTLRRVKNECIKEIINNVLDRIFQN